MADFGKYQIVTALGHGGMADVFLANLAGPAGFNRLVVVKSMRSFVADDPRYHAMLMDEARLAARLRHPNVVQTHEVGDVDGRPFIAMEYLDGQPLNAILIAAQKAEERLAPGTVALIVCEALAGLHYAHELKGYDGEPLHIVHRDISPHNIFVTYMGEVKLVDFGIAKATTNASQTELGSVKGKIAYMAPEQARGDAIDGRADVFAMGLVLWELLASRRMLEGDSTAKIFHRLLYEPLPHLSAVIQSVDPALAAVVDRSLAKRVTERYQSADEMRTALLPFAREVQRDDIARKVRSMFEAERAEMQERIRGALLAPGSPGSSPAPPADNYLPTITVVARGSEPPGGFDAEATPSGPALPPPTLDETRRETTAAPSIAPPSVPHTTTVANASPKSPAEATLAEVPAAKRSKWGLGALLIVACLGAAAFYGMHHATSTAPTGNKGNKGSEVEAVPSAAATTPLPAASATILATPSAPPGAVASALGAASAASAIPSAKRVARPATPSDDILLKR